MHTSNPNTLFTIQRRVGYAGAGACLAITILNLLSGTLSDNQPLVEILSSPAVYVVLGMGLASYLTSLRDTMILRLAQILVFIGYSYVASLVIEPGSLHGALFGVYGVILCLQYGLLKRKFWLKIGIVLATYIGINLYQVFRSPGYSFITTPGTAILIAMFIYLFWVAFAEEIREYTEENTELKEERDYNKVFVKFGQNISGVVHNLRSSLMSVDGYIDLLQMSESEEKEELLRLQRKSTENMLEMISNFMGAVRSYQGKEAQDVSLNELVRSSIEILKGNPRLKHRLKIKMELQEPDTIHAVPMEIMQVIDNVVTNASESMRGGEGYHLTLRTECDTSFVKLSVRDEGSGIAFCNECDEHNCLSCSHFAFGRTTKPGGAGIGMMYVRQILTELEGELRIESERDRGTTVHMLFPASESAD